MGELTPNPEPYDGVLEWWAGLGLGRRALVCLVAFALWCGFVWLASLVLG